MYLKIQHFIIDIKELCCFDGWKWIVKEELVKEDYSLWCKKIICQIAASLLLNLISSFIQRPFRSIKIIMILTLPTDIYKR